MDKLVAIIIAFLSINAWAEMCPSVQAIKTQHAVGWKAYDSDDGAALSSKRAAQFKQHIEQFVLAQSIIAHQQHAVRCYYRDKNGSELEAYLQKENLLPNHEKGWYQVSGSMHCAAGMNQCTFQSPVSGQTQLAKK